jgi:ribosome recycling factor
MGRSSAQKQVRKKSPPSNPKAKNIRATFTAPTSSEHSSQVESQDEGRTQESGIQSLAKPANKNVEEDEEAELSKWPHLPIIFEKKQL